MALISNSTYSDVAWDYVTDKIKTIISGEYSVNPYISPEFNPSISTPFRVWPGESETVLKVPTEWQREYTTSVNYYFKTSEKSETFYEKLYIETERLYQLFHNNQTTSGTFTWIDGTVDNIDVNKLEDDLYDIELIFRCKISRAEGDGVVLPVANTYSLLLDGTNEYVDCGTGLGTALGDNYSGSLSVSLWFKADATNVDDGLFQLGTLDGKGSAFFIFLYNNELQFRLNPTYPTISGGDVWKIVLSFTDTGWNNIVCIYDTSGSANSKMYLNGTSVGTLSNAGNFPDDADMDLSGEKTIIGAYWSTSYPFAGNIDEVSIWDKALSSDEVTAISGTPCDLSVNAGDYASSGSLVSWWRFGDGTLDDRIATGLVADQVNATLGSEVTTDPSFDTNVADGATGTYWRLVSGTNGTMSISGGKLISAATSGNDCHLYTRTDESPLVSGQLYKLVFTLTAYTSGRFRELAGSGSITPSDTGSSVGTYTIYWVADSTTFDFHTDGVGIWEMSDISVKPVNGNPGIAINSEAADFEADVP